MTQKQRLLVDTCALLDIARRNQHPTLPLFTIDKVISELERWKEVHEDKRHEKHSKEFITSKHALHMLDYFTQNPTHVLASVEDEELRPYQDLTPKKLAYDVWAETKKPLQVLIRKNEETGYSEMYQRTGELLLKRLHERNVWRPGIIPYIHKITHFATMVATHRHLEGYKHIPIPNDDADIALVKTGRKNSFLSGYQVHILTGDVDIGILLALIHVQPRDRHVSILNPENLHTITQ